MGGVDASGPGRAVPRVLGVARVTPQPVHNVPLLLMAETGVAGGLVWLWLMVSPIILAWRPWRAGRLGLWALGLAATLVTLSVIDLFDFYSWGWPQGRLLRWLTWGLWSVEMGKR